MSAGFHELAFTQPSTPRLRRLGINGTATVRFDGTALEIQGAEGGQQRIEPARVVRVRSGRDDAIKYGPSYETRLWLVDGSKVVLSVLGMGNAGPYIATMRAFGQAMAAAGPLGRMEGGTSVAGSLLSGRLLVPLVPGILTVIAVLLARRSWPRPVASLGDYRARLEGSGRLRSGIRG